MKQFKSKNFCSLILVRFAVCFVLLGISYRLLFSSSFVQFFPLLSDDEPAALSVPPPPSVPQAVETPQLKDDLFVNLDYTSYNGE